MKKNDNNNLGKRLKKYIFNNYDNYTEFCKMSGISPREVSQLVNGKYNSLSVNMALKLELHTGIRAKKWLQLWVSDYE